MDASGRYRAQDALAFVEDTHAAGLAGDRADLRRRGRVVTEGEALTGSLWPTRSPHQPER